mgnify:CR=1 FL=1
MTSCLVILRVNDLCLDGVEIVLDLTSVLCGMMSNSCWYKRSTTDDISLHNEHIQLADNRSFEGGIQRQYLNDFNSADKLNGQLRDSSRRIRNKYVVD